MLGWDVCRVFAARHEVIPTHRAELDLTDTAATLAYLRERAPGVIVHCAGYTNVDQAEQEPEAAFAGNVLTTWNVVRAAQDTGSLVVYISTDFVFDGTQERPYHEFDAPRPLGVYAQSKWAGEQLVRSHLQRFFIVRTAGLFGLHGRNFVAAILERAEQGQPLRVVSDQVCCRTYTVDLAEALLELIDCPLFGTYHLTNAGYSSWYDFAREILAAAGLEEVSVQPISSAAWDGPARRPAYSVLDNLCWRLTGHQPLRPCAEALRDYLAARQVPNSH